MVEKSSKSGGLILLGLAVGGIFLLLAIKSRQQAQTASSTPTTSLMELHERISHLEKQLSGTAAPVELLKLPVVTLLEPESSQKYKNKEGWVIKRDTDGAIVGIEIERNASVGVSNGTAQ